MLPRPVNGMSPALFGRLSYDLVIDFEREILLGLQGFEGLEKGEWTKVA